MSRTHLRAFLVAFVVVLALAGATLIGTANGGDADGTAVAANAPETSASTEAVPAADAERVLSEAAQAQALQAYADAVQANEAEQARQLEALAQAENEAALQALAQAQREASSGIPDSYWDRMAQCETGGNWSMVGSQYSGGVGFYNGTWDAFGGREFAARAGQATREQQIIVANRVANRVGLTGWGCLRTIGRP
jgi:hypothetical protein